MSAGARFCGACGADMAAPVPPAAFAPPAPFAPAPGFAPPAPFAGQGQWAAPGEQVLCTIPEARIKTGIFGQDMYVLVVTDRRLIGARITGDLMKQIIEEARAEAKAEGKGFFGQWGAQIGASITLGRRYAAMNPEAILRETPGNWALDPSQVRSIRVERRRRDRRDEEHDVIEFTCLRIKVETASGTATYDTDTENPDAGHAREILARAFGPVVR